MNSAYEVEYSEDQNEICIIPKKFIPFDDFVALTKMYSEMGYKYWLPTDNRRGYRFRRNKEEEEK